MPTTPIYSLPYPAGGDNPNGPLAFQNLAERVESLLGFIGSSGVTRVDTEQTTTSSTFALLGTPDRVQNLTLVQDGLIFATYQADCQALGGAGNVAFFLDSTQLEDAGTQATGDSRFVISTTDYNRINSVAWGFQGPNKGPGRTLPRIQAGAQANHSNICAIEAAAGTYELSVRFKCQGGTTYAKNRILRAWTQGYGIPAP